MQEAQLNNSWIKIHRKISEWRWFDSTKHLAVFMHLLVKSNYKISYWHKRTILPGQICTGRKQLAEWTGLSEQTIRTVLKDLESTNEITSEKFNDCSIITVVKWSDYQENNQRINHTGNHQLTIAQPSSNHIQEVKEVKKIRNKEEEILCRAEEPDNAILPEKSKAKEQNKEFRNLAIQALNALNDLTGKEFRPVDSNLNPIIAKFKSGCTFDQVEAVIGDRYNKWRNDPKMQEYIRPDTIFRASKFECYLAEAKKEFKV